MMKGDGVIVPASTTVKDAADKMFGSRKVKYSCMRLYGNDSNIILVLNDDHDILRFFSVNIVSEEAIENNEWAAGYELGETVLVAVEDNPGWIRWFTGRFNEATRMEKAYYEKIRIVELSGLAGCVALNKDVAGVIKRMVGELCVV